MRKDYFESYRVEKYGEPLQAFSGPVVAPAGRELQLRTRRCGVCHSDLHIADGYYDLGGGKKLQMADRNILPPLTPGHEVVGELVSAGPDADLSGLVMGRSYLVCPWIGCGTCERCAKGEDNLCLKPCSIGVHRQGGYSDVVTVPEARYLIDIEGLDPTYAATLACSGLTAYSAIANGDCPKGDWLGLIGMGGVGSAGLLIAQGLGYERVLAVDVDAGKLAWARANGAQVAVNARDANAAQQIKDATGGGAMAMVDFVGSSATAQLGIDVLTRGGTYVIVGLFGGDITLPLPSLPMRAITLRGTYTGNLGDLRALVAMAQSGKLPQLPTETIELARVNEALERLRLGTATVRQVISFD